MRPGRRGAATAAFTIPRRGHVRSLPTGPSTGCGAPGGSAEPSASLARWPDPTVELPTTDHEFWEAVRALPARQAQAIALHYLEDRPVAEIAEILGCAPATVKVHLHRGRRALADTLAPVAEEGRR